MCEQYPLEINVFPLTRRETASAGLSDMRGTFSLRRVCPDTGTAPQPTSTHLNTGAGLIPSSPLALCSQQRESCCHQSMLQSTSAFSMDQMQRTGC